MDTGEKKPSMLRCLGPLVGLFVSWSIVQSLRGQRLVPRRARNWQGNGHTKYIKKFGTKYRIAQKQRPKNTIAEHDRTRAAFDIYYQ